MQFGRWYANVGTVVRLSGRGPCSVRGEILANITSLYVPSGQFYVHGQLHLLVIRLGVRKFECVCS